MLTFGANRCPILVVIYFLLRCDFGTTLFVEKNYEREHLFYVRSGRSVTLSRLSAEENEILQGSCGYRALQKGVSKESFGFHLPGKLRLLEIPELRLAGADFAVSGQFPWSTSFFSNNFNYCGGVLISDRHVLTAMHCFFKYKRPKIPCSTGSFKANLVNSTLVKYGGICVRKSENCPQEDMKRTKIEKIIMPISFNDNECLNGDDYAVVELAERVKFSNETRPICLRYFKPYHLRNDVNMFTEYANIGWGRNEVSRTVARLRYFRDARFISVTEKYKLRFFTPSLRSGICLGDSGSPMQARHIVSRRYVLLGINSGGPHCYEWPVKDFTCTFLPAIIPTICHFTGVCPPQLHY